MALFSQLNFGLSESFLVDIVDEVVDDLVVAVAQVQLGFVGVADEHKDASVHLPGRIED